MVAVFYASLLLRGSADRTSAARRAAAGSCCRRSPWCALFGFDCAAHILGCGGRRPRPSVGAIADRRQRLDVGRRHRVRLLPPPESLARALEKLLLLGGEPVPLWVVWLVIGLTPGGLRRAVLPRLRVDRPAVARRVAGGDRTALLFGVAHASIYRLLPTLFLGILLRRAAVAHRLDRLRHRRARAQQRPDWHTGAAPGPGSLVRDGHGVWRFAVDAGAGRDGGDGRGTRGAVVDDRAGRDPRDAGYDAGAGCAGSNSTLMVRHLP